MPRPTRIRPPQRPWFLLAGMALLAAAPGVAPAHAAPPPISKSQQFATQAKKAYVDAKFDRAFDLYQSALRADPGQAAYLFAAARAAHQAGKLDRAEETYLLALKATELAPDLRAKCQTYLDGIATTRAEARAQ